MIKDLIERFWTPVLGAMSSVSVKGIVDLSANPDVSETADWVARKAVTDPQHHLITYLWIGMLGALGGLIVKVLWGLCKKRWPKLKNLEK